MQIDEAELRRVSDELEIRGLVARYADAASRGDAEAWRATWAPDGRWILGGNTSEGADRIIETWRGLMALFERIVQLPQDGVLELEGDAGTGRWSVIELGRDKNGSAMLTVGIYHDVYRREESGWKFGERRFEVVYAGAPDLTGAWIPS